MTGGREIVPRRAWGWRRRSLAAAVGGAAVLVVAAAPAFAASGDEEGLRILFIGNSLTYTNDLPAMVKALIDAAGSGPVEVETIAFPNYGLEDHWRSGPALGRIASGDWDWVVYQQGPSATEGRPSLLEYAPRFARRVRRAGARPALYMVWPAASRRHEFAAVSGSYRDAAHAADAVLLPVGDAWVAAWRSDPSLRLYGVDGFHPSGAATYLAALVIARRLTGLTVLGLPSRELGATSPRLSDAFAKLLQEAAAAVTAPPAEG